MDGHLHANIVEERHGLHANKIDFQVSISPGIDPRTASVPPQQLHLCQRTTLLNQQAQGL